MYHLYQVYRNKQYLAVLLVARGEKSMFLPSK